MTPGCTAHRAAPARSASDRGDSGTPMQPVEADGDRADDEIGLLNRQPCRIGEKGRVDRDPNATAAHTTARSVTPNVHRQVPRKRSEGPRSEASSSVRRAADLGTPVVTTQRVGWLELRAASPFSVQAKPQASAVVKDAPHTAGCLSIQPVGLPLEWPRPSRRTTPPTSEQTRHIKHGPQRQPQGTASQIRNKCSGGRW
jgi:hypothetical protein